MMDERSDMIYKVVIPGSSLHNSSVMESAQPTAEQAVPESLGTEADQVTIMVIYR
jgi:hypothetical protein